MKITKLLLLSLAVIFFSCSEDEDPKPTTDGMVGAWNLTALTYKGKTTTTVEGNTATADFTGTGKDMDFITTFSKDPNEVVGLGSYTIVLKTTMAGQTTTEEYPFDEILSDGTWSLSGNTLTVTEDNESQEVTVLEQTSTTMKLRVIIDETQSVQEVTLTTKVEAVYTFTKQ